MFERVPWILDDERCRFYRLRIPDDVEIVRFRQLARLEPFVRRQPHRLPSLAPLDLDPAHRTLARCRIGRTQTADVKAAAVVQIAYVNRLPAPLPLMFHHHVHRRQLALALGGFILNQAGGERSATLPGGRTSAARQVAHRPTASDGQPLQARQSLLRARLRSRKSSSACCRASATAVSPATSRARVPSRGSPRLESAPRTTSSDNRGPPGVVFALRLDLEALFELKSRLDEIQRALRVNLGNRWAVGRDGAARS